MYAATVQTQSAKEGKHFKVKRALSFKKKTTAQKAPLRHGTIKSFPSPNCTCTCKQPTVFYRMTEVRDPVYTLNLSFIGCSWVIKKIYRVLPWPTKCLWKAQKQEMKARISPCLVFRDKITLNKEVSFSYNDSTFLLSTLQEVTNNCLSKQL